MEYAIRTLVVLGVCYLLVSLYFVAMNFSLQVLQEATDFRVQELIHFLYSIENCTVF